MLTYGIPPEFRGGVHLFIKYRHMPSGQSRFYRVTQLRTDGLHCRESAGTGPANLKVVPNEYCLGRSPWTNIYAPLFPTLSNELILMSRKNQEMKYLAWTPKADVNLDRDNDQQRQPGGVRERVIPEVSSHPPYLLNRKFY